MKHKSLATLEIGGVERGWGDGEEDKTRVGLEARPVGET
jgi:hypothetical protein